MALTQSVTPCHPAPSHAVGHIGTETKAVVHALTLNSPFLRTRNRERRIKSLFLVEEQDPAECWVSPSGSVAVPLLLLVPVLPLMIVSESPTSAGVLASLKDVAAARFSVSLFFPMCGLSMTAYNPPSPRVQTMSESYSRVDRQQLVLRSWALFSCWHILQGYIEQ